MYKISPDSNQFTSVIKSHEFVGEFHIKDTVFGEGKARLQLRQGILSIFLNGEQAETICIDDKFKLKYESLPNYELEFTYEKNNELAELIIITKTLSEFIEWKQAILVSKRPNLKAAATCKLCDSRFYLFRKRYFCKYCGSAVCSYCCMYRMDLQCLGYNKKQEICRECVRELRPNGSVAHGSLVMHRQKIETRSVLE